MKKNIAGKRYDTNSAELIGKMKHGTEDDSDYYIEELYHKRTGEFFLYGKGAPGSKYSKAITYNKWVGSCDINPISDEEAEDWARKYADVSVYQRFWGNGIKKVKRVTSVSLSPEAYDKLKKECTARKISASRLLESMILDL